MKNDNKLSLKKPEILFLSFFGVGFLPKIPGTWGTLAICPFLYYAGQFHPPFFFFIPFILILTMVSSFLADKAQRDFDFKDPQWIVIDEVLGMMVAWLFIQKHSFAHLAILFVLFRFFDIVKIYPASYFDQKVKHGAGVILDDIVSGFYAGLIYYFISKILLT